MSRSYRKTPIIPIASNEGTRWYKRLHSGRERAKLRAKIKTALATNNYDILTEAEKQLIRFDEWLCPRDGRIYLSDATIRLIGNDWRKYRNGKPKTKKQLLGK